MSLQQRQAATNLCSFKAGRRVKKPGLLTHAAVPSVTESVWNGYNDISVKQREAFSFSLFYFLLCFSFVGRWKVKRTLCWFHWLEVFNTDTRKKNKMKYWYKKESTKSYVHMFLVINGCAHIMLRSNCYFSFPSDLTVCLGPVCFPLISLLKYSSETGGVHLMHKLKWVWRTY